MDIPEDAKSDEGLDWGNTPLEPDSEWGTNQVGWDEGEGWGEDLEDEKNDKIQLGDLYILLLESKDKPILCNVTFLDDENNSLELMNDKDKYIAGYDKNYNIILKTEDYEIIEIIRVKEFNLDDESYIKEREDIEFETLAKLEKDKIYSDTILFDDLLSHLIKAYDCYDNQHKISEIYKISEIFSELIKKKEKIKKIPKWLIPIIDNDIEMLHDDGKDFIEKLIQFDEDKEKSYSNTIKETLNHTNSIEYKEGIGYNTDKYNGVTIRECSINSTCVGIMGEYKYDERKINKPLLIPQIIEKDNKEYNQLIEISSSNNINIIGYLEEPYNKMYYYNNDELLNNFLIYEKYIFNNYLLNIPYDNKKDINSINHLSLIDSVKPENSDYSIFYNFSEKLSEEKATDIILHNSKNDKDIIELLLKNEKINTKIMNYRDLHNLLFKYNIKYHNLDKTTKKKIDTIISDNISDYISDYNRKFKKKKFKELKVKKNQLTDKRRSDLAYDYIMGLMQVRRKNELLKEYIDKFTRNSDKQTENPNFLYCKYSDNKICKHYLYSTKIDNGNNIHEKMKTKFGSEPINGKIYCRICNEYLCDEEYSELQGFSDDKPIQTYEKIQSVQEELEIKNIDEKLEKKKDNVQYIDMFSNMIGVNLTDKDKYLILLSYDCVDHNNLADTRYKTHDILNNHSKLTKEINEFKKKEKKEKDKKKIDKINKKKDKFIGEFKSWVKDTNKILILLTLVSLFIQTAIPVYNIRRNIQFNIINKDNKSNKNVIEFVVSKFKLLFQKYEKDTLFTNCSDLISNNDIIPIEEQLNNCIEYCNNSIFSFLIERKEKYFKFLENKKIQYLRSEWVIYKPLKQNELNLNINKYLEEIHNDKFLRVVYGGPLIENISIVRSKNNSEILRDILKLSSIKIIENISFTKLFRYVISCYGKHQNKILINLLTNQLVNNSDKQKEIIEILSDNNWDKTENTFKELSFKKLRENVIPKILALYTNENTEINTCHVIKEKCNKYVHISVNNYDLHQLNTFPKRIYQYIPPKIYPESNFKEINKDIVNKLFNSYKKDSIGNIVKSNINNSYLDKYLLDVAILDEKIDEPSDLVSLVKNEDNFRLILETKRNNKILQYNEILPYKNQYTEEDYNYINSISFTDNRIMNYLQKKLKNLTDEEKNNSKIKDIITKLPNPISDSEELTHNDLLVLYSSYLDKYLDKLYENKKLLQSNQSFEMIFSEYINFYKRDIDSISDFISLSDYITADQKERFEKIVNVTDKKMKFSKTNIQSILNIFIESNFEYNDIYLYISDIRNILSRISSDKSSKNGTFMSNKCPKEWKITDSVTNSLKKFYEKDKEQGEIRSNLLLHNRIFSQPRKDYYIGFNMYEKISDNANVYLKNLFNHVLDEFSDLELLKGNNKSHYKNKYSVIYCKYQLIKIIKMMIEYIEGLKLSKEDIISDAMPLFRELEGRTDDLIEESIQICSIFIFDLVTNILMTHYDPSWLFMNKNIHDFNNRLSKQRENEKQKIIEKRHNASSDERLLMKLKKDIGEDKSFKEASEEHSKYVNTEDYANSTEEERLQKLREIYKYEEFSFEELPEIHIPQINPDNMEEEGYIGEEELNENNEEYLDDFDEEQEMEFNE